MSQPNTLPDIRDYEALYRAFRWQIPERYNIGVAVCDRWAARDPRRLAILHERPDGKPEEIGYGWLKETSNRLANVLGAHGIKRGDRVAILLPQMPEVAAIHVAIYKLGAVALPLATLFGVEAIKYRLANNKLVAPRAYMSAIVFCLSRVRRHCRAAAELYLPMSVDNPDLQNIAIQAPASFQPIRKIELNGISYIQRSNGGQ